MRKWFLLALVFTACSPLKSRSPVVATVNGKPVTLEEFQKAFENQMWKDVEGPLPYKKHYPSAGREVLERLLQKKLLLQEADRKKISVSEKDLERSLADYQDRYADRKEFENFLRLKGQSFAEFRLRRLEDLKIRKLFERIVSERLTLTPGDLQTYYENHRELFRFPEQIRVRQIVTDSAEKAVALREMIGEGVSFREVAEKYSLTPDRNKGGDLGWFSRGAMPEEFDKICFSLSVGKLSGVIKTRYGHHLFEVLGKRGPGLWTLPEAEEKIRHALIEERGNALFSEWYEALKLKADIRVQEELLAKEES